MAYTTIDDPSAHFQALVYAGTGGLNLPVTHTNTGNSDLQPDFIWFKDRGATYQHYLVDSSRGRAKGLHSDDASAETTTDATGNDLVSFDTDGFKVGAPSEGNSTNGGTTSKVAWQWKANGGTTASNSNGNITSTVQANTTAGFSIVTWTGNESASATVGHGLGVTPKVVIIKSRSGGYSWNVYLGALPQTSGNNMFCFLDTTSASFQVAGTAFNSSTFQPSGNVKRNGGSMLAYCFAEIQGYSKFGSYVGNGNANGTFVYLGFQPAFVMLKPSSAADNWIIVDNKRDPSNAAEQRLFPDTSGAEGTGYDVCDMLSNGFKMKHSSTSWNGNDRTYIYMAFAEHPFVSSSGIPTTAR